jgi:acyl-CoA thioester hydrolase
MLTHEFTKRVRYGETDQMGYVYYGNYAQYYEIGRVEMLRSLGLTYKDMESELGIMMPVASMQIRYLRPARYDELIRICTTLRELPGKYITFHVELYNEEDRLINAGEVRLCFVDMKTGRTTEPPQKLMEALRPHFKDNT